MVGREKEGMVGQCGREVGAVVTGKGRGVSRYSIGQTHTKCRKGQGYLFLVYCTGSKGSGIGTEGQGVERRILLREGSEAVQTIPAIIDLIVRTRYKAFLKTHTPKMNLTFLKIQKPKNCLTFLKNQKKVFGVSKNP